MPIELELLQSAPFCPISVSGSNFNPRNTKCMPAVKIFVLTRGVHAPCPNGQQDGCPIPLSCGIVLEPEQKFAFLKNPAAPLSGISATLHQASLQGISDCKEFCQFFDSLAFPAASCGECERCCSSAICIFGFTDIYETL